MKTFILISTCTLFINVCLADDKPVGPPPVPDEILYGAYHDYKGCKLIKVEADGITISHSLGVAKLLFTQLPPEMRKAYGYDPDAAKKAQEEQAAKDALSDQMADKVRLAEKEAKKAQEAPTANSDSAGSPPASTSVSSNEVQKQERIQFLMNEISENQRLIQDEHGSHNSHSYSHGAYDQIIAQDTSELASLRADPKATPH
jgi:hypothetical protein